LNRPVFNDIRIGIDIGGTFTDFVIYNRAAGSLRTFKLPTTPLDPAKAVLDGLNNLFVIAGSAVAGESAQRVRIVHGSTVATNALLERKGAPTALITTRGFRDILQIGRQNRPSLYDLSAEPPPPLVKRSWRLEVDERVDNVGQVLVPLDITQLDPLIDYLRAEGVTSVAISLLFSFLHPAHEQAIARRLYEAGFFVSSSHEVLPEYREYERTSTTVVNAYVSPILDKYIATLEKALVNPIPSYSSSQLSPGVDLRIMQSNGGSMQTAEARRTGVRCIVSGPAGGVVGAVHMAKLALDEATPAAVVDGARVITFDMGGTSTDVSLCVADIKTTSEATVGGCPIGISIIDVHTVGAGGGSIAAVDLGGALRVGPQSAGADPGPACYGHSDIPTVTDANVVLGRLPGKYFLGGQTQLDESRALLAMSTLGRALGMSPTQAAQGVIEIVNAHMERALRVISIERGHDPRDFMLVSFGGAGGLHAVELARRLGISRVLVSPLAATLSAFGMLVADVIKDYAQTVMLPGGTSTPDLERCFAGLCERGLRDVADEGVAPADIAIERSLDMRYRGQSYELPIPYEVGFMTHFHESHRQMYGYARADTPVEIVNVRVRIIGHGTPPPLVKLPAGDSSPDHALLEVRPVMLDMESAVRFYRGESLRPGNTITGPAIIVRSDTTILLDVGDTMRVDGYQNMIIDVAAYASGAPDRNSADQS
jgi:N-methylhydantoinase A